MRNIIRLIFERKERKEDTLKIHEELRERGREQFQKLATMGLRIPIAL